MRKLLQILEALTKNNVRCLMCYISGLEITKRMFLQKKIYAFLSGSGGTGKSHLVKTIYQTISEESLYHSKEPDKPRVLLLGPIDISAINIGGTTIHSGLGISDNMKACLRNKLSEVKMVIINEFSMVSSDLFFQINAQLLEIFICSTETEFAGLIVILVDDLLQLPPV